MPDPNVRASDHDRSRAIRELRRGHKKGRLTEAELKEREARAGSATTVGELSGVLAGLPGAAATKTGGRFPRNVWGAWLSASIVTWAIWAAVVLTSDDHNLQGLWPIWVSVPWGAVILANGGWRRG